MNSSMFMLSTLFALVFCSALAIVFTKHLTRQAYIEISINQRLIDELGVQWSQLQIEESTFSEYGLIEREARDRLGMRFPGLDGSVVIAR